MADLDRLTRRAACSSRWLFLRFEERVDLARFAIVEHLLSTDQPPGFFDLVNIGERAIWAHVEADGRYRGVYLADSRVPLGTPLPRFWRYWTSAAAPSRSPEDAIVERTALRQIWPRLSPPHRRVLLALAEHDDDTTAAAALGRAERGFVSTLSLARQQFLRWWHEHETPSRVWGRDRRSQKRSRELGNRSTTAVTIRRRARRRARQVQAAQPAGDSGTPRTTPVAVDSGAGR